MSKLPRAHLLDPNEIDKAIKAGRRCVLNDGGEVAGCALEIHVRNGNARGVFRYPGAQFGEPRIARHPLGPYHSLPLLWAERAACEKLIRENKSPKGHYGQQQEEQRAAARTVRQAMEEFFAHAGGTAEKAPALWKSPESRKNNNRFKRKHLDNAPIMDLPVGIIRPHHLNEMLEPHWGRKLGKDGEKDKLGSVGVKLRSLFHSMFERETANEFYSRPNPASWKETAPLTQLLGPMVPSTPYPSADYKDIPRIIAHLSQVRKLVPGYLTVEEAAFAYERAPNGIRAILYRNGFAGVILRPHHAWNKLANFIPESELKARYGEFKREPVAIERTDVVTNCEMLRGIIYTAVRPHMMCEMRWEQIKEEGNVPYIEYRPAENGRPSEHKNGWGYNFPYLVILTPGLRAIIETQRQQQLRDSVEIVPSGLVFRHARTHNGIDRWFGQPIGHRTLSDYLRRRVTDELGIKKLDMTPAGMRATFGTWAKEQYECPNDERNLDELIDMTLGHIIPVIRNNPTNHHYLYNVRRLNHRWELMVKWEQYCLSLCPSESNVVPALRRT
jgi:integrase